jgi:hypothetical protein
MKTLLNLAISLPTLCAGLSAQALPIQEGHDVILATELGTRMVFLSADGEFETGPAMGIPAGITYDQTTDTIFMTNDDVWTYAGPFLYSYDPHTHQQSYIGATQLAVDSSILAAHPSSGELFYIDGYGTDLYTIDKQTAALTFIGATGAQWHRYGGAAFHPQTQELFATEHIWQQSGADLVTIDTATGANTVVSTLDRSVSHLAFDRHGTLYGLFGSTSAGNFKLVQIDPQTGITTTVCSYPLGLKLRGLSMMPATEPVLSLSSATPAGGQPFSIAVTGAKADAHTWLAWSLTGTGSTVVPQLNVTLGLASPVSSSSPMVSRLDGRFAHTVNLPSLAGLQVWLQAAQMDMVSNVAAFTIQ